nr:hypothetical protein [Tanacetum cinerariifolium]
MPNGVGWWWQKWAEVVGVIVAGCWREGRKRMYSDRGKFGDMAETTLKGYTSYCNTRPSPLLVQGTDNYFNYETVDPDKVTRDGYVPMTEFLLDPYDIYLDCYMKGYKLSSFFWPQLVPHLCTYRRERSWPEGVYANKRWGSSLGKQISRWVNRLAKLGSMVRCVLPEALRVSAVQHDPQFIPPYENEKQKLRSSSFSFLSSRQKLLMPPKRTSTSEAPTMTPAAIRQLVADSVTATLEAQAATWQMLIAQTETRNQEKIL